MLLGSRRTTADADFGLVVSAHDEPLWPEVESAVITAARDTGVTVQYSNDIDRWSSIAMPDYQRHTRPYKRFGRVSVHLLDPAYWPKNPVTLKKSPPPALGSS